MVEPQGARANSWEDVADLSATAGIVLDGWQETILRASMGERRDATWAAKRVGVTVPRQNGKSQLLVSRALAGALLFGEKKIVISAHQQDTAREAFSKLMEIVEADANGWLRERVKSVMNALNRESIKFTNGATIQFKARSGAGGKGFSSDCLMLDEAQILGSRAWTSINSTMSAMPNPQVWLLGTAPQDEDDSTVFESVRAAAIEGKSSSAAWCEWGADVTSPEYAAARADLAARRWSSAVEYLCWSANPAWNARMNVDVVTGECETYAPERFAQDRLGIWSATGGGTRAISADLWRDREVGAAPVGTISYGVAFSMDGTRVSLAGARKHDGGVHGELIDAMTGPLEAGIAALADWLAGCWRDTAQIVISGAAGAATLKQALRERGVPEKVLRIASTGDYTASCAMLHDAIRDETFTHLAHEGQAVLDDSVAVSDMKRRGTSGAWGWEATIPDGDETPLEAVSLAVWGAKTTRRKPGQKQRAVIRR
ncbi:terminase large subunit domain-containing protein [Litorihabitans aurantiacus]|uniref:terminase large subunit domain-containing protein n=1 Tax=Litorihabitans aurantiacus TaxID=1930061 RepID=UPI0024E182D3|nr:terminase large subunit [Litorihabitans aurantiacus]